MRNFHPHTDRKKKNKKNQDFLSYMQLLQLKTNQPTQNLVKPALVNIYFSATVGAADDTTRFMIPTALQHLDISRVRRMED